MFKNKIKKYGNGAKIGRNPPPLVENSILFLNFFFEPFPKALKPVNVGWRSLIPRKMDINLTV